MKTKTLILPLLFSLLLGLSPALAEEAGQPGNPPSESVQNKISQWRRLRAENPQEFQKRVQERKEKIHQRVSEFREKNPEKFETVKSHIMNRRREKLTRMREQDPQQFQREMGGRMQKFDKWKNEHPEKFQQFAQNHPRMAEKFQRRQQNGFANQRRPNNEGPRYDNREQFEQKKRPDFQNKRPDFQGMRGPEQRQGPERRDFRDRGSRRRHNP